MPVVSVNLLVDDKTHAAVEAGVLEICGLAKDVNSRRIAKHIPVVTNDKKKGIIKALDYVKQHKNGVFLVSSIVAVAGTVGGVAIYKVERNKRNLEKQFAKCLQVYLDAARSGKLTIDMIDELNQSLSALSGKSSKSIHLKISATQLSDLIHSIFDYTKRLANVNNIDIGTIVEPKSSNNNTFADLQYYLNIQKNIFEQVA